MLVLTHTQCESHFDRENPNRCEGHRFHSRIVLSKHDFPLWPTIARQGQAWGRQCKKHRVPFPSDKFYSVLDLEPFVVPLNEPPAKLMFLDFHPDKHRCPDWPSMDPCLDWRVRSSERLLSVDHSEYYRRNPCDSFFKSNLKTHDLTYSIQYGNLSLHCRTTARVVNENKNTCCHGRYDSERTKELQREREKEKKQDEET